MTKNSRIPNKSLNFLLRFMDFEERENFAAYADSVYRELLLSKGRGAARLWFWGQFARSLPRLLGNSIKSGNMMLKSYSTIALRNMKKQKLFTFINISGLAIGMTCCLLILLYVQSETSYDRFHNEANDIYRLIFEVPGQIGLNATTFGAAAPTMKKDFPEVLSTVRIRRFDTVVSYDRHLFSERNFFLADPDFFDVFSFSAISGDPKKALAEPFSVLVTEYIAKKYFGGDNPIGKTLRIDNRYDYRVAGVLRNPPSNSHLKFDFLASFSSLNTVWGNNAISWDNTKGIITYIKLRRDANPRDLENKFPEFLRTYRRGDVQFHLQPLTSIHLHSHIDNEIETNSDIRYVYILSSIAVLIMLIACFNYMQLSTSRSACRLKDIGVRRIVGAEKKHIIMQVLWETMILTFIAMIISVALAKALLPTLNFLIGRDISFAYLANPMMLLKSFALMIFVGYLSGSYPALFFSSVRQGHVLKGFSALHGPSRYRKVLFGFQFFVSVVLFICTLTVYKQNAYIKNKDLGLDKEQIIIVDLRDEKIQNSYEPLKNELRRTPDILGVYVSSDVATEINALNGGFRWEGYGEKDSKRLFYTAFVDEDFLGLMGIHLVEGRSFSKGFPSDTKRAYLLNETAARSLGWENSVGKRFGYGMDGTIVGVIKDFHHLSLHSKIGPTVFVPSGKWPNIGIKYLFVKINRDAISRTLSKIEATLRTFSPQYPFSYSFFDERVNRMYIAEKKFGFILNTFSSLAIFIACLGLFGLMTFLAEQRTKEIGIRRVLGASMTQIVARLSKGYLRWVLVATVLAWPVAYYAMNRWLQGFAYRTPMGIGIFILSGLSVFMITVLTISSRLIRAASANPIDSLRYE
jgi:putative ABC transport system permease protein